MFSNKTPHLARSLFCATCTALVVAASGCAKDEINTLFDENGVWSMVEYDLEGTSGYTALNEWRLGGFLLRFNPGKEMVAVASCQDDDDANAGMPGDPTETTCVVAGDVENWYCDCFWYAFEESSMCWKESTAGGAKPQIGSCGDVPDVPDGGSDTGGGDGGDGGTGDGGGTDTTGDGGSGTATGDGLDDTPHPRVYGETAETLISLSEDLAVHSTYIFSPLPPGLFASREFSRFKMQKKADMLFDATGCIEECGM